MPPAQLTPQNCFPLSLLQSWGGGYRQDGKRTKVPCTFLFGKFLAPPTHILCCSYIGGKQGLFLSSPDPSCLKWHKDKCESLS